MIIIIIITIPSFSLGRQMGWMVGEKMKFFSMITTATSMRPFLAKAGCTITSWILLATSKLIENKLSDRAQTERKVLAKTTSNIQKK